MSVHNLPTNQDLDAVRLREVFGVFPSGVVAVAAEVDDVARRPGRQLLHVGQPRPAAGVVLGRATSSKTWPVLRRADHLGVTILADHHDEACRQLAGPQSSTASTGCR